MKRIKILTSAAFLLSMLCCQAQTFDKWAHTVGWDGISHWTRYMLTYPAYQGPNSLPVPKISNGSVDSSRSLRATGLFHFSKGDNTQTFVLSGNYCLVKDVIAFNGTWVPYERFEMSQAIKEKRHVFYSFFNDHEATGEVDFNTSIQLLNKFKKYIHLALRAGYRFPSSSEYGAARYTDAPGYYFDLSFGKSITHSLQWIGMLGFYCWQLESDKHRQDDAFLFGTGLEWNSRRIKIQSYVAGYLGYIENSGDEPIVFRTCLEKKLGQFGVVLNFQQGLQDFKYTSIETGIKYDFK